MEGRKVTYSVNLDNPVSVYVQIENQVQFAITAGHYKPGDLLPSVRDMSNMVKVNPNTVTKAYRDLELMGLVTTRRGVGVMVSENAARLCKEKTKAMVLMHLRDAVAECLACGIGDAKVVQEVQRAITGKVTPYSG